MSAPPHEVTITSHASDIMGCGAWYENKWFQLQWTDDMLSKNIVVKELIRVILTRKQILSNWDNSVPVTVLSSRYTEDKDLMQLLHCLHFHFVIVQMIIVQSPIPISAKTPTSWFLLHLHSFFPSTVVTSATRGPDLSMMDPAVHYLCEKGVAKSTHQTHSTGLKDVSHFLFTILNCVTFCCTRILVVLFFFLSCMPKSFSPNLLSRHQTHTNNQILKKILFALLPATSTSWQSKDLCTPA